MNAPLQTSALFRPSDRLSSIGVSEILKISGLAAEMKRQGRDVIVLGAGEPDFDTPDSIKDAAGRAMRAGATKYTALDGAPDLKAAIRAKFKRDNGLDFAQDEITVSAGAKQVLFNAMMATINPGDEVIIPTPFWVTYADIVAIAGGTPVLVPCSEGNGFRLSAEDLERAITPRTRWVMLNSPSNPTGAAYSEALYRPILDVLLRHPQVWLMVDDIYEHIVYDGFRFATPAAIEPALRNRTLTVNGVSKAYAMTGWRIGYGAGPRALIRAMAVVQSQSTSCPSTVRPAGLPPHTLPVIPGTARSGRRCIESNRRHHLPEARRRLLYFCELRRRNRESHPQRPDVAERHGLRRVSAARCRRRGGARFGVRTCALFQDFLRDLRRRTRGCVPAHRACNRGAFMRAPSYPWALLQFCAAIAGHDRDWRRSARAGSPSATRPR
jgi:aspartate aminotransferase